MEALSSGFCAAALNQSLSAAEVADWQQQWPQPTLQVVDIQRYPRFPTATSGPCRFYLAVSDGQTLVWLVIPPQTPLEEAIAGFELEVGCCLTLLSHTLVKAANGLNVVIPLEVKYSSHTLRLLGQPNCAEALFPLSPSSLVRRTAETENAIAGAEVEVSATGATAARRPTHRVAVRDFVENPEKALGNWSIAVRVVWRGHEYQMHASSRTFGSSSSAGGAAARYVFRCLLVDDRGDGIVAAFYGGEALLDRVQLHDCLVLQQGTVKWGVGDVAAPVELQFGEKSIEELLEPQAATHRFPFYAAALVGEVAEDLRSVAQVLTTVQVGDFTSVVGVVAAVQASAQITTKRGRVWRSVVTLADDAPVNAEGIEGERGRSGFVEVTLWGDIAEAVEPAVGERWVFHGCALQLFQQRKTLSSRASTMAVQLRSRHIAEPEDATKATTTAALASPFAQPDARETPRNTSDIAQGQAPDTANAEASVIAHLITDSAAAPVSKAVQFVLNLSEASATLPVLTRVQEVIAPLLTWQCSGCHTQVESTPCEDADLIPECCRACGNTELIPSFHLTLRLSDGLSTAVATLHGSTAETLLQATALEVARALQRDLTAAAQVRARLVGVPVFMCLLPDNAYEKSDTERYIAVACKHVDYVSGCHMLLSALEAYADLAEKEGE